MSNDYFKEDDTLLTITENYPQTIAVFSANGFPHMADENKRKSLGRSITLKQAMQLKGKSVQLFSKLLVEAIIGESKSADVSLRSGKEENAEISLVGALPCPVRIPLLERLDSFMDEFKEKYGSSIKHDLKAASQGAGWLETYINNAETAEELPDLFISAGFETFFDHQHIGRFKDEGVFEDMLPFEGANRSFADIDIRDPKGDYSMISVVPAVFLVNTQELGDRPVPQGWADILQPCFENRISLPVGDFDLFSSLLIHIFQQFGAEGVKQLGRSLLESMHPAEMVKSDKKKQEKPIVTIMPYFFTKMIKPGGTMQAVWPQEGAIISPIFLLTKTNKNKMIQPVIDFFASKEVGEVLAHNGLFPSLNPEVDNRLAADSNFMWVGWDYIYSHDIPAIIKQCETLFNNTINE